MFIFHLWDRHGLVIKQGTLLHIAAYCGAIECVKYLLKSKAEVDKRDEVCFHLIMFLFRSSSFFASHRSPLYLACISGHALIVQELINAGADPAMPDLHYWYPIHRATLWSHINVMRVLIKAGADVNMEDDEGVCLVLIIDRSTSLQNGITSNQQRF